MKVTLPRPHQGDWDAADDDVLGDGDRVLLQSPTVWASNWNIRRPRRRMGFDTTSARADSARVPDRRGYWMTIVPCSDSTMSRLWSWYPHVRAMFRAPVRRL